MGDFLIKQSSRGAHCILGFEILVFVILGVAFLPQVLHLWCCFLGFQKFEIESEDNKVSAGSFRGQNVIDERERYSLGFVSKICDRHLYHLYTYVLVNSKPDHPPGPTPGEFF